MRIRRLELLRYGHFSDATLDFSKPAKGPDVHIVFGLNEAGKSTAKSAVEDLLFGIRRDSPYNFQYENKHLRIGAVLENGTASLPLRRRKGNRNTLLKPDDGQDPSLAAALASLLGDADRDFFERMFSLDRHRLHQGGREILAEQGEIGQILFAASAGLTGLRELLATMQAEAESIWTRRRAKERKYYQVSDKLKAANDELRQHTVTAEAWRKLKRELETASGKCQAIEEQISAKSAALAKLRRVRRVYLFVNKKWELEQKIEELGAVPSVPEDARRRLEGDESQHDKASTSMEVLVKRLEKERRERESLHYDQSLLQRAEEIERLREWRSRVAGGKSDLPALRADLDGAEEELKRLATELQWDTRDTNALIDGIPSRGKVVTVQTLLTRHGGLKAALENAQSALHEADQTARELKLELENLPPAVDISPLDSAIRGTREAGDINARIGIAKADARKAEESMNFHLGLLQPPAESLAALIDAAFPARDSVQAHRDEWRQLHNKLRESTERAESTDRDLKQRQKRHQRQLQDQAVIPMQALTSVRASRDSLWSVIRGRYIDEQPTPDAPDDGRPGGELAREYEATVEKIDELADRRFANARAIAELEVDSNRLAADKEQLQALREECKALDKKRLQLDAAWRQMWSDAPFDPPPPDSMSEWLTTREKVLQEAERLAIANDEVAALSAREAQVKATIIAELTALGMNQGKLEKLGLLDVLEAAKECRREHISSAEKHQRLRGEVRKADTDRERKHAAWKTAERELGEWKRQWTAALDDLGLDAKVLIETVAFQIETINSAPAVAEKIRSLRHDRIAMIETDVKAFNQDVAKFANTVAPELADQAAEEAVLELEGRLENARQTHRSRMARDKTIADLENEVAKCEQQRRVAASAIRRLREIVGVEDTEHLREAIAKAEALGELRGQLSGVIEILEKEGDGFAIPSLENECRETTPDLAAPREEQLNTELEDLREQRQEAREQRAQAERQFAIAGGSDAAARAATARQSALAEMRQVAEQYVRVRAARELLGWAIERYQREQQAPLLEQASGLFATITDNAFKTLRVEFDDQDQAHLIGIRQNDATVDVQGMSAGTADQLYLALRVASVEEYLERTTTPLPFIADDLFANFDDRRAAAGLDVLGHLATRTQVLFFTHHRHLVEIAKSRFGDDLSVLPLGEY